MGARFKISFYYASEVNVHLDVRKGGKSSLCGSCCGSSVRSVIGERYLLSDEYKRAACVVVKQ
jgi:hypothetical protein